MHRKFARRCHRHGLVLGILAFSLTAAGIAPAVLADVPSTQPVSPQSDGGFDTTRYMRVSEVRPGMVGYGLSVFKGTRIERFDVQVLSVLHDFNPKYDVVLIRCHGANLEHTGPIAGMSGSPIFLRDGAGHDRMIGAFAYGWPLQKDPIAGVQPIQYMLQVGEHRPATTRPATLPAITATADADNSAPFPGPGAVADDFSMGPLRWNLADTVMLPGMQTPPPDYPLAAWNRLDPNPQLLAEASSPMRLQALATPLEVAGVPPTVLESMGPLLRAYGLVPLQAGGGSGSAEGSASPAIEPGSVLALPLLEGDVDLSAIGTCTDRIGNRVLAFGHPFQGEGPVSLPISGGSIDGVIANLSTSFKLGTPSAIAGTLTNDATVGIAGTLGAKPATIPISLRIRYTDGSEDQTYHFTCAVHPKLTPLLTAMAVQSALMGQHDLPQYHTLDYDLDLQFSDGHALEVHNALVNASAADVFFELATPIVTAANNPFERVMPKSITGTFNVTPHARAAEILYADVPRSVYRPGDTVRAYVAYRPFRDDERMMPITMALPADLPDGSYSLTISDWQKYLEDERTAEPFKFTAENIGQVFDVLRDISSIQHKAVYIRLLRQPDGVAIGHTAMPKLPSSRRAVMIGAGRSDTTQFVSSALRVVPTSLVMSGSCDFEITIDRNADTDLASATRLPHRDVRPNPPAAPLPIPVSPSKGGK